MRRGKAAFEGKELRCLEIRGWQDDRMAVLEKRNCVLWGEGGGKGV